MNILKGKIEIIHKATHGKLGSFSQSISESFSIPPSPPCYKIINYIRNCVFNFISVNIDNKFKLDMDAQSFYELYISKTPFQRDLHKIIYGSIKEQYNIKKINLGGIQLSIHNLMNTK